MTLGFMIICVAFMFGACAGSFLNVCIWRLPRRCMSIAKPRGSICPACQTPISPWLNIPILAWLALRGRCAACKSRIRIRYPVVELLTACMFALAAWMRVVEPLGMMTSTPEMPTWQVNVQLAFDVYLVCCVVVLSYIDLDLHIIPDEISFTSVPLGLIAGAIAPTALLLFNQPGWSGNVHVDGLVAAALGMLAGGGSLYALGKVGEWCLRKPAMGLGDVKIMAGFGAFIGWDGCILAIFLASLGGALFAGVRFFSTRSHHLAFGPYLALGALVVRFLDMRVFEIGTDAVQWVQVGNNRYTLWGGMSVMVVYLLLVLVALRRDGKKRAEG